MKDARLEFTCHEWGVVIPAHDAPLVVRPKTKTDADNMIRVIEVLLGHLKHVRGTLPASADITSEPASLNQVVDLRGVRMLSKAGL